MSTAISAPPLNLTDAAPPTFAHLAGAGVPPVHLVNANAIGLAPGRLILLAWEYGPAVVRLIRDGAALAAKYGPTVVPVIRAAVSDLTHAGGPDFTALLADAVQLEQVVHGSAADLQAFLAEARALFVSGE